MKYWPVETNAQPVVWAGLELRSKVAVEDIQSIEAFTNKFTVYEIGSEPQKWDPQSRETPITACHTFLPEAVVDGPLTEETFSLAAVRDPVLRPLMNMIKVTVDPRIDGLPPGQVEFRLVAQTHFGDQIEVIVGNPLGHPDRPMQRSEIAEKFLRQCEPVWGSKGHRRRWKQSSTLTQAKAPIALVEAFHVR